jgi:hypothetical protein
VLGAIGGTTRIGAAIGIGRAARSLLFEVEGYDPAAMLGAALLLAAVP